MRTQTVIAFEFRVEAIARARVENQLAETMS